MTHTVQQLLVELDVAQSRSLIQEYSVKHTVNVSYVYVTFLHTTDKPTRIAVRQCIEQQYKLFTTLADNCKYLVVQIPCYDSALKI